MKNMQILSILNSNEFISSYFIAIIYLVKKILGLLQLQKDCPFIKTFRQQYVLIIQAFGRRAELRKRDLYWVERQKWFFMCNALQ